MEFLLSVKNIFCFGLLIILSTEVAARYQPVKSLFTRQLFLGKWRIPKLSPLLFYFFSSLLFLFLTLIICDVFVQLNLVLSFILYFLVFGQMGYLARKTNLYPFVLVFLAFLPTSEETIFNSGNSWLILFIKTLLGWVYLSSFLRKMKNSSKDWFSGLKIKTIITYYFALEGKSVKFLNRNKVSALMKVTSWMVLFIEGFFWIWIFSSQHDLLFISIIFVFHLILYFVLGINYIKYYLPVFAIVIINHVNLL